MKTRDRLGRWCTAIVLTLALLAAIGGTMPRSTPAQETGRLVVTIVDEKGEARGGACVLVVDWAGAEQKVCDEDGDGAIVVEGLVAGTAKVVPLQGAKGCAGSFGGEVEVREGEEAWLSLTDVCEPLPPAEEETPAEGEKPSPDEKPTEEPTPTEEVKPTEEPQPTATATLPPTPTVAPPPPPTVTPTPTVPPPTTGDLIIALTSATFGAPSLGACWEVLDQATFATIATGCDGDDGSSDGQRAFSGLTPGRIVVQQISGDHNDNPTDARVARIVAGKTTSLSLMTMPLADLVIVPVAEDGVTPLYDACFAVYRGTDYSIGRDACSGPDGRAVFTNLPAYYWRLEETIEPTVTAANGLRQPYSLDGPPSVYHDVAVDKTVIATHHLHLGSLTVETVGADYGQPVYGACAQVDGMAGGPTHLCDSDLDGQIVLTGLAVGDYTVTMTGNAETLNGITYRANEPGARPGRRPRASSSAGWSGRSRSALCERRVSLSPRLTPRRGPWLEPAIPSTRRQPTGQGRHSTRPVCSRTTRSGCGAKLDCWCRGPGGTWWCRRQRRTGTRQRPSNGSMSS